MNHDDPMPPRPVHRWKSLWLGLIILIFLTWAWERSCTQDATIGARLGKDTWQHLVSSGGYLSWYIESFKPGTRYSRSIDYNFATTRDTAPWFPPPFTHDEDHTPYVSRTIHGIAHWLITLLFLLSWSTLLLWRHRRLHRLTAGSASPSPAEAPNSSHP